MRKRSPCAASIPSSASRTTSSGALINFFTDCLPSFTCDDLRKILKYESDPYRPLNGRKENAQESPSVPLNGSMHLLGAKLYILWRANVSSIPLTGYGSGGRLSVIPITLRPCNSLRNQCFFPS